MVITWRPRRVDAPWEISKKGDQGVLCTLRTAKGSKGCSSAADDGWLGITPLTFEQLGQEQSEGVLFATQAAPKRVPNPK